MLEFRLIADDPAAFRAAVHELHAQGHRRLIICPGNALADEVAGYATTLGCEASVATADGLPGGGNPQPACYVMAESDPVALSAHLLALIPLDSGIVVAPRTRHAFDARALFLISIPKAGTHLLYSLAEAFGYGAGIICPEWPRPQHWYCLEHSNSHTRATDFFIDTVRRSPFGNRHHAFATTPALFIYRNPLDVLVSEANYYHRDGNAIFGGYLRHRSFEERVLALIDDPWLFGSFRDRMAGYIPWLDFPNVIPVSFEELVGARGGGDDAVQRRLIWSLQLKLHVPGSPDAHAARVFDPESATFNAGQIGSHREKLGEGAMKRFMELPQDFMGALGYAPPGAGVGAPYPLRAGELMRRPLTTMEETYWDTPILIEAGCHGRSIVRYRGRFYGPMEHKTQKSLASMNDDELAQVPSAAEIAPLKHDLALLSTRIGRLQRKLEALSHRWKPAGKRPTPL